MFHPTNPELDPGGGNLIDALPSETIREILMSMSYDDVISYCSTRRSARLVCQDDLFWLVKLDREYRGRPSDYVRKYWHPDTRGIDIYRRWKSISTNHYTVEYPFILCIQNGYNDIVMWMFDNMKQQGMRLNIFTFNTAIKYDNTEIVQILEPKIRDANIHIMEQVKQGTTSTANIAALLGRLDPPYKN